MDPFVKAADGSYLNLTLVRRITRAEERGLWRVVFVRGDEHIVTEAALVEAGVLRDRKERVS